MHLTKSDAAVCYIYKHTCSHSEECTVAEQSEHLIQRGGRVFSSWRKYEDLMQTITNHVKERASRTEGAFDVYALERKQMRQSTGQA